MKYLLYKVVDHDTCIHISCMNVQLFCLLGSMWTRAHGVHGVQRCLCSNGVRDVHGVYVFCGVFSVHGVHGVYGVVGVS